MPYFLCSSVSELCEKCGCKYEYYNIDEQLRPMFNKTPGENEYIYIVNYYGQFCNDVLAEYKKIYGNSCSKSCKCSLYNW